MARSPEPGGLKPSLEAIRLRGKACPRGGECGSGPAPPFPQPVPALYDRSLRGSTQYYPLFSISVRLVKSVCTVEAQKRLRQVYSHFYSNTSVFQTLKD